jgi:hypothetical protein
MRVDKYQQARNQRVAKQEKRLKELQNKEAQKKITPSELEEGKEISKNMAINVAWDYECMDGSSYGTEVFAQMDTGDSSETLAAFKKRLDIY